MTDFDYKKYSLEHLENWLHDAMSADEATPQEIYDVIKEVVSENYHYHKHHVSQAYELLSLLNAVDSKKTSSVCDKDNPSEECKKSWNNFCDDEVEHSEYYYDYDRNKSVKDLIRKWIIPVEIDSSGEYFILLPDDLLEAANLKEGDQVEWVDNGDRTYILKKVNSNTIFYHPV